MRLLIIDDEKIVLDSVVHIVSHYAPDIQVETARNGKEGLRKLEEFRPHAIMSDIRMPGMSGLEFIKEARVIDPQVKIIIATAFDQFDYAKEAFKYRVEDYVLKPLTKQKLIDVVEKVRYELSKQQKKRTQELDSIDRLYRAMTMVESNFFYTLLHDGDLTPYLETFRELMSLKLERGRLIVLDTVAIPKDASWQQSNEYHNRLSDVCVDFQNQLKMQFNGMVSQVFYNRIYAYIESDDERIHSEVEEFLESSYQRALKKHATKLRIAYSPVVSIEQMTTAVDLIHHLLVQSQKNIMTCEHTNANRETIENLVLALEDLYERVMLLDERWINTFDRVKDSYLKLVSQADEISSAVDTLFVAYVRLGLEWELRENVPGEFARRGLLTEFRRQDALERLNHLKSMVHAIESLSQKTEAHSLSEPVTAAVAYIRGHYTQEISLEDLSKLAHVTPQYMSKIFKDDMGMTYKTFLTDLRLTTAKEHLKQAQLSIKDIAYRVGFNDPNYFVRLFKKVTGFTPSEYQKVMGGEGN